MYPLPVNHGPSEQSCKENISYKNHVTNEEGHAKIQQVVGPYKDKNVFTVFKVKVTARAYIIKI